MLFIYTLPFNLSEGLKFLMLYIKQNFGMSATRLCKSLIYFCIFKETVAVLYGNTYYETPCTCILGQSSTRTVGIDSNFQET